MGIFTQPGLFAALAREARLEVLEGPPAVETYGRVARAYHGTGAELTPELEQMLVRGHAEIDKLKAQTGGMLGAMLTALIPPALALSSQEVALTPDHLTHRGNAKKHRHYLIWAFTPRELPGALLVRPQGFFFGLTQFFAPVQDILTGDQILDKGAIISGQDQGQVARWLGESRLNAAVKKLLATGVDWRVTQAGAGAVVPERELQKAGTLSVWIDRLTEVSRAFP